MDLAAIVSQIPLTTLIDYLAVAIGVVTGTLYAIEHEMDTLGAAALGLVTGFGGGVLRDLLLQDQGIFFMEHPMMILGGICISVLLSLARRHLVNFSRQLFYIDAFCMAWFALAGVSKSWAADAGPVISVVLGCVTAVGGGALRDICTGETPSVFLPGKFYGISSVVGAVFFVVPVMLGVSQDVASALCVASGFALTVLSERFNWRTRGNG